MPSKIGPHILNGNESARQMIRAGSRIVKFISEFGLLPEVTDPTVTVIGRWHTNMTAEAQRQNEQPEAAARRFLDTQKEHYAKYPTVKLWEGHNEPVWGSKEDMQWYSTFEVARLRMLADMGLRGVIGNFATGSPGDIELWKWFVPAVQTAKQFNGVLGLHEYSSPWMWWMTGKYQLNPAEDEGEEGWVTLRYRKIMNKFLKPEGCDDVLIAITEAGLDRIGYTPVNSSSGNWRTNAEWWPQWNGSTDPIDYWRGNERDPQRYFAEQLIWYDKELRKNPNMLGATIFTVGCFGEPWTNYDIAGTKVAEYLADYIKREANVPDAVAPTRPAQPTRPSPVVVASQPATPTQPAANLIDNGSYERGVTQNWRGIMDLTVPNGWEVTWKEGSTELPNQSAPFQRPRSNFVNDKEVDNVPALRMFGEWRTIWWQMKQTVNGLAANARYRFSVQVRPDPVTGYAGDGSKMFASNVDAVESRLVVNCGGQTFSTDWADGTKYPFGKWGTVTLEFTATAAQAEVQVEARGRYGLTYNSCFIGPMKLEAAGAASAPNAIKNSDFGGGTTFYKDQRNIEVPEGWTFWCADESTPKKGPESFKYPRANIITPETASPDDLDGLADVPRAYRVVGNWRAIWFSISQNVTGLTSGNTYRVTAKAMPDPVDRYEGANNDKVFVSDPDGGEVWIKAVSGGQQSLTLKRVNADFQPGAYLDFTHEFVASGSEAVVTFEVRARYPLTQNAWYIASINVNDASAGTASPVVHAATPATPKAIPSASAGKRGITGTLRLFAPDKLRYAAQIENIKFIEEIQNQTSERKTYGLLGVEVLNKDTGEKKFHTSFSGEMILGPNCKGPKDSCGGEVEDQMVIEKAGNYRLSLHICHSSLNDCTSGKGDWEQLSPHIDIAVIVWQPGQENRADAAPGNFTSRNVVGNEFWIENPEVRANEAIWFNFKVTNPTDNEVPYSLLAARTDSGFSAQSWANNKLGAHQVLEWKDNIKISEPGVHNIFLGIFYDGVDNGLRKDAKWDKLSNSVQVVVKA
ncbi:MAG: hypothetical protein AABZ78_17130 [Chloroflexota bacterium]